MTRRNILLLWIASILYFVVLSVIIQLLVWYAPERVSENPNRLAVIFLASPMLITLWTSFTIFYSLLAWPLLAAGPKPWLEKHKVGFLYCLLWRELRDKFDAR
jgi:hypothetical protein